MRVIVDVGRCRSSENKSPIADYCLEKIKAAAEEVVNNILVVGDVSDDSFEVTYEITVRREEDAR